MKLSSILQPERTVRTAEASSKKKAIELAANTIVRIEPGLEVGDVYRSLIDRERLGTTAIGHGVALPHCRLASCTEITGALFVLDEPVDFAAYDDEPVDIIFVLLVPQTETNEHLKTLAMLAERFEDENYRKALRTTRTDADLFQTATADQGLASRPQPQ